MVLESDYGFAELIKKKCCLLSGIFNDPKKHIRDEGNQSLLVFLVTCLIVALLVVVIFFGIKLRRAHIIWKRGKQRSVQLFFQSNNVF